MIGNQTADGASPADALASGLAAASWVMAVFSVAGVLMACRDGAATARPRARWTTPLPRRPPTPAHVADRRDPDGPDPSGEPAPR